ncbi:toll-like receptor 4 [Watersipora subatra]|uniref:toll-like receptor 4 n=1 Tax=Watersipora subatra TaxID=2589382 RepID=UPI00355C9AD2
MNRLGLIRVLKLNNNNLQQIPTLNMFTEIHTLDLSNNELTNIPAGVFSSLGQLLHLDISFNNITLSERTIRRESFQGLTNLKTLRMKQNRRPTEFDYEAVTALNETLEELYITGTPTFSTQLSHLSHLHTLSLGGYECNVPSLKANDQPTLSKLPLKRFSARNCKIQKIDRAFLQNFWTTLERLDLSCNHLTDHLIEITLGVGNKLETLILDNINRDGIVCPWNETLNGYVANLKGTPLQTLSLQANQVKEATGINLRELFPELKYLDLSQNDFSGVAFYIAQTVQGQPVPKPDLTVFYNKDLQLPALRFIGLQALTTAFDCGGYDERILNCNEDSPLFLDDDFYWDHNHQPDIVDFQLLLEAVSTLSLQDQLCLGYGLCFDSVDPISQLIANIQDMAEPHTSYKAINNTIYYLLAESQRSNEDIVTYIQNIRFFLVNLTTAAIGYNNFVTESKQEISSDLCSNIYLYPNNADTLNFSYSNFAFGACSQVVGFKYLTTISCIECRMRGWNIDTFQHLPLQHLEMSRNELGQFLREDLEAERLRSTPLLRRLDLGEQQDGGILYFSNRMILANHPNLTHLDLHGNHLIAWNISISENKELLFLDLRDNEIFYIDEVFRNEIDDQNEETNLEVKLAGNDVRCTDFTSLPYIHWLINSSSVVDTQDIVCAEVEMTITQYLMSEQKPAKDDMKPHENLPLNAAFITGIAVLTILGLLLIGWFYRHTIIYKWYRWRRPAHASYQTGDQEMDQLANINSYLSYSDRYVDDVIAVQKILQEDGSGVTVITRDRDATPGLMTQVSVARFIAQSDRPIVFLTPDYLKDPITKFEFELLKQKGFGKVILVTFGMDSVKQLEHLPALITDIISNEKHIVWPRGICARNVSGEQAAAQALLQKLRKDCGDCA